MKHYNEFIPRNIAEQMLIDESELIQYLNHHKALEFRFNKARNRLDLYADEKYLMMGRMKHPDIFQGRGRMGFMELYISRLIKKKIQLAKGST